MLSFLYVLILGAGILVIMSKNTVQSVLYLILVFLLCSLLFIYLGADFIGLIILIVYIGAIAVLFLFVVMMLNIRLLENSFDFYVYIPIVILFSLIFVFQSIYFFFNIFSKGKSNNIIYYFDWNFINNIQMSSIGELLFNKLYILFLGAAFLLFVAMVGAIVLTLDDDSILIKYKKVKKIEDFRFFSENINWKYTK